MRSRIYCQVLALSLWLATGANLAFAEEGGSPASKVDEARVASENNPANAQLKYQYAEALRVAGKNEEAVRELLAATELNPSYYLAYHQLTLCSPDAKSLAEAVKRLTFLMNDKPKELMLRVALSELLEAQGHYFQASKVLVEMVFDNAVPPKFTTKVNNRIRFLQAKARGEHANRRTQDTASTTTDNPPLPLPEENLSRGLSASRLEKTQELDGFGHSVLQH
ncbi:MAG: tetratricopeptide repeat protein [Candidatus Obscuribacterales bacterium]|nr:tetratricopeptide repeat protein [Candidatus Obscuribacterales bacterium]